ncbi:MAG TPA: SRPBCC family protein [Thermoleophilaceae bacterium]|nr:SRPBCC family protein [Thermoleophilaceae bacterium]
MRYSFLTTWLLEAPRERAWDLIEDAELWPQWWRGVERVEQLDAGDANRVGSRFRIAWRSRIPYSLEFDFTVERVERPSLMEGRAEGELHGRGRWRLLEEAGVTAVLYEWNVITTKRWMNLIAPLARPVFEYNHDVVMGWGGQGLADRLGVSLLASG